MNKTEQQTISNILLTLEKAAENLEKLNTIVIALNKRIMVLEKEIEQLKVMPTDLKKPFYPNDDFNF